MDGHFPISMMTMTFLLMTKYSDVPGPQRAGARLYTIGRLTVNKGWRCWLSTAFTDRNCYRPSDRLHLTTIVMHKCCLSSITQCLRLKKVKLYRCSPISNGGQCYRNINVACSNEVMLQYKCISSGLARLLLMHSVCCNSRRTGDSSFQHQ